MGMNFYLERKIDYIDNKTTPATLGCGYNEEAVQIPGLLYEPIEEEPVKPYTRTRRQTTR